MGWTTISPGDAEGHPLYGVKGWLAVFAVGLLLYPGAWGFVARDVGTSVGILLSLPRHASVWARIANTIELAMLLTIYGSLIKKEPRFRVIASVFTVATFPVAATLVYLGGINVELPVMKKALVYWIVYCAVWLAYLNRSRRVRVTFEHRVRTAKTEAAGLPAA